MKDYPRPITRLAAPIKSLAQRFALIGLVVAAFALMILGKADTVLVERFRDVVTDTVAPILDVVSRPIASTKIVVDEVRELAAIRDENARLNKDKALLLQWQTVARRLEAENTSLRAILNYVPDPEASFITSRVIADTGGAFAHSLILNAGKRSSVGKGQAVMTGDGLVGRIASVGNRASRVLLITDLNSRIPVIVESTRARAILAGNNSNRPRLIHLPQSASVTPGDRVVTSGHGGAFPQGLPVGIVASVADTGITVQPFVARNRLEYVRVLDFGLEGILPTPSPPAEQETPAR
ncbi:MAG: rod shape-determining protein MreC [Rhodospirillales bacterium]|nr:rod shape-determining protein MreC [Rhodospirillales bacterium]